MLDIGWEILQYCFFWIYITSICSNQHLDVHIHIYGYIYIYMVVSRNGGTPKVIGFEWKIGNSMDDSEVSPLQETSI